MFISSPKPPPTPDPYATAAAQTAANLTTAIGQTKLQNADEESPDATVTYSEIGTYVIQDPQYNASGVQVGTTARSIPISKRTVAYKPAQQAVYNKSISVQSKLNDFASQQADNLNSVLGTAFSLSGLPSHASIPEAQVIQVALGDRGSIQTTIGASDTTAHYDVVRAAILTRPTIKFNIDRSARVVALRNSGIVPGMTAYDNEMRVFDFRWNDEENMATVQAGQEQSRLFAIEAAKGAFFNQAQQQNAQQMVVFLQTVNQAALQRFEMLRTIADFIETFRSRSMQEIISSRAVSMNELSSLLHGAQISTPQFEGFRPGKLDNTPVGQYVYQSAALDQQKYQTQVQQSNQLLGGLFGLAGSVIGLSDPNAKTDIGGPENYTSKLRDLPIKSWRYKPEFASIIGDDGKLHLGAMADDFARAFGGDGHTISYVLATNAVVGASKEMGLDPIDVFGMAMLILKERANGN